MTEISIPFTGFYNTVHDATLDKALEQAFTDDSGTLNQSGYDAACDRVSWRQVHEAYAAEYASVIAAECALPGMTFNRLVSPREYNFCTDEIICDIPADTLADVYQRADKQLLAMLVAKRLRARDGFIPFYSDSLDEWGAFDTWDDPQIDLLIESWCDEWASAEWRDCYAMDYMTLSN